MHKKRHEEGFIVAGFYCNNCGFLRSPLPAGGRRQGGHGDHTCVAWFVEQIGGDDFTVNVLLPPGADHHIWEAQHHMSDTGRSFTMGAVLHNDNKWGFHS